MSVSPARILDTRYGIGAPRRPVAAYGPLSLPVTGANGIPAGGVSAVLVNVSVLSATRPGYLTAWPDGAARTSLNNLFFYPGRDAANLTIARVGADGRIDLINGSPGTAQIIVDVFGYYLAGAASTPGTFTPLTPARVLDTRVGLGAKPVPVAANSPITVALTGRGGVPSSGVSAVALNIFAITPGRDGGVNVYPAGTIKPLTVNAYFQTGQSKAGLAVTGTNGAGQIQLFNGAAVAVHYVVDVVGYYTSGTVTAAGAYQATTTTRVLDTRSGLGSFKAPIGPGATIQLQLDGRAGIPASGVSAVLVNEYALAPAAAGSFSDFPGGTPQGHVSNGSFLAGTSTSGLAMLPVGTDGSVLIRNTGTSPVQVILDTEGYVLGDPIPATVGQVAGLVTDADGAPLSNVLVTLNDLAGGSPAAVLSDGIGRFFVSSLPPADYGVFFQADALGHPATAGGRSSTGWVSISGNTAPEVVAGQTDQITQAMATAGAISGRVTDAAGHPLSGIPIETGCSGCYVDDSGVRTRADGSYLLRDLSDAQPLSICFNATKAFNFDPGGYQHQCLGGPPAGYGNPNSVAGTAVQPTLGQTLSEGITRLSEGAAVTGRVTDPSGKPVAGLDVYAYASAIAPSLGLPAVVTTDVNGAYTLGGLGPGAYSVCVYPQHDQPTSKLVSQCYQLAYPFTRQNVTLAAGHRLQADFPLTTGGTITIRFTDSEGHPVSGVAVGVDNYVDNADSDANGIATIPGREVGNHTLCFDASHALGGISAVGYRNECYQHVAAQQATPIAVQANKTTSLSTVLTPATGAILTITDPTGHPIQGVTADLGQAPSGPDGTLVLPGLPPGQYTVCVLAQGPDGMGDGVTGPSEGGYRDRCTGTGDDPPLTLTITAGTPLHQNVIMNPLAGITGTVTDPHGHPLTYAQVEIYQNGNANASSVAYTDSTGVYHARRLEAGQYKVCFQSTQFDQGVPAGGDSTTGYQSQCFGGASLDQATVIELPPAGVAHADGALAYGGAITGTVTSNGQPVPGLMLYVSAAGSQFTVNSTTTDSQGHYRFLSLASGGYQVCSYADNLVTGDGFGYLDNCNPASADGPPIAVSPSDTATADLLLNRLGGVAGTVTDDAGTAIVGASVTVSAVASNAEIHTMTGPGGRWFIQGLVPGFEYTACFDASGPSPLGYQSQCFDQVALGGDPTPIAISADKYTPNINARLQRWGGIAGTVTPAEGSRIIQVSLYQDGVPLYNDYTYTDAQGHYSFDYLPAGTYRVRTSNNDKCNPSSYGGSSPAPVTVKLGQLTDHIDIAMTDCPYG